MYKIEQHSSIKQAHRLSAKVCWPTSLERQNVNLALRIFNDSTCAALKIQNDLHPDCINDTSNFVDVMSKVWKIFNINTPYKHVRLNDEYSRPLIRPGIIVICNSNSNSNDYILEVIVIVIVIVFSK